MRSGRPFPWRRDRTTAFQLLIAEVLLRQTKADDVVPVWRELVRKYPTPLSLSRAGTLHLQRTLRCLGLHNQRAEALVKVAQHLLRKCAGRVPRTLQKLQAIPHVGQYTAAALACFKFGQRVPIVDANVMRVLGRIAGSNYGNDLRRNKKVWEHAWCILPIKDFKLHNYGILDFGAAICKPRKPSCPTCPLLSNCKFGSQSAGK